MNVSGMVRLFITCFAAAAIGFLSIAELPQVSGPNARINTPVSGMPVVQTNLPEINSPSPIPKRGDLYTAYLQCCVQILTTQGIGSGTISYYDEATDEAYVLSCGHLFSGNKKPGGRGTQQAQIDVFYKNDYRLKKPQRFVAEVICYDKTKDISLLKFRPDWVIQSYFPIAPKGYPIVTNDRFESTGCDEGTETAAYTITIIDEIDGDLFSKHNSPRPGRSGGGLLTPDGYCIGICWATTAIDGSGYGVFVPLSRIHDYLSQFDEIAWLLEGGQQWSIINSIPLIDHDGNILDWPQRYIPLPHSRSTSSLDKLRSAVRKN